MSFVYLDEVHLNILSVIVGIVLSNLIENLSCFMHEVFWKGLYALLKRV